MRNRDKYPKLHKTLEIHFGTSKADELIGSLVRQVENGRDLNLQDHHNLHSAFVFTYTAEGWTYWENLTRMIDTHWWLSK